ncbi:AtpZ/AtpI family protein [Candidatus Woesebacteria bacterium]|nr:AtpZ/AtpI family protein [Candidatus Woesebacteria bacterium]
MSQKKKRIYSSIEEDGELKLKKVSHEPDSRDTRYIPPEYFNLGMYFLIPILLGLTIGLYLDKRFDREGLFTILMMSLGVFAAFYNLYSLTKKR